MRTQKQLGFTLVELSMVLAILGLLIGTVFGAQAMLKNQRLRAVGADATKYLIAMNQFKLKYSYLAGDFPTATSIWGRADGGVPVTSNCASTFTMSTPASKATCNGDGDGVLDNWWNHERYRAWQHLSAAEYIVGQFTGVPSSPPILGVNVPRGIFEATGYAWVASPLVMTDLADADYTGALNFGKLNNGNMAPETGTSGAALTPAQQYELDTKLDDGLPYTGNILAVKPTSADAPNCVTGSTSADTYKTTFAADACSPIFLMSLVNKNNR